MSSNQTALRRLTIRTRMPGAIVMLLSMFGVVAAACVFYGLKLNTLNENFTAHSVLERPDVGNARRAIDSIQGASAATSLAAQARKLAGISPAFRIDSTAPTA